MSRKAGWAVFWSLVHQGRVGQTERGDLGGWLGSVRFVGGGRRGGGRGRTGGEVSS